MNWFILSILAGLAFAVARVVARFLLKKKGSPLAFTAIHDFIAGLTILPLAIIYFRLPENNITWVYFAGVVVFAFLADWSAFTALKKIDISLYQIITQIRHILIIIGGLLVFSEAITIFKLFSVLLIIVGVIVALYVKSKIKLDKRGVWLSALSTVAAVIAFLFAKQTLLDFSTETAVSLELILIGLLSFTFLGFSYRRLHQELVINGRGLVISGIIFGVFELLLFLALSVGEASRVVPAVQSSLIFAVIAGVVFLKERSNITQKIVGTILIMMGIGLLYLV